ncbi:hypothetical protein ACIBJE_02200 [Micromonospora sp. NPDC050187]|uniref:hypothetical protein n=1 Tax=Micromonospora sp. NPDC050187 TaxID=3364277 RepID=UPI0037B8D3AC
MTMTDQTSDPDTQCGATDNPAGIWRCTKPAGHTGDRHTAEIRGVGSMTWGYVPTPDEGAADSATVSAGIPHGSTPYTDAGVELVSNAMWAATMPGSVVPPPPISRDTARAALDYLARAGRLTTQGRCGETAPDILGHQLPSCSLTAGHAGWHRGDDGSEWTTRKPNPATEAHIRAGADALVRLRTQAPSLSELDADDQDHWLADARAVLMAAGGVTPVGSCPCTCHQPGQCPCKPGAPKHHHGAGGYCTVASPGYHVLAVADDRTWTIEHPADCTITPKNGGPSGPVCLIEDLAREQLHDDKVPPPGRYEVEANDIGDRLCIFDRLDGPQPPADRGCQCSTDEPAAHPAETCYCEDLNGRLYGHPKGTGRHCSPECLDPWHSSPTEPGEPCPTCGDPNPGQPASSPAHDHTTGHPLFAPSAVLEVRTPAPETWTGVEWNAHVTAATRNRSGVAERLVRCPTPICTTTCPAAAATTGDVRCLDQTGG